MKWYEDTKTVNKILKVEYEENLKNDYYKVQEYLMDIQDLLKKIRNEKYELKTTFGRNSVTSSTTKMYELQEQYIKLLVEIDESIKELIQVD